MAGTNHYRDQEALCKLNDVLSRRQKDRSAKNWRSEKDGSKTVLKDTLDAAQTLLDLLPQKNKSRMDYEQMVRPASAEEVLAGKRKRCYSPDITFDYSREARASIRNEKRFRPIPQSSPAHGSTAFRRVLPPTLDVPDDDICERIRNKVEGRRALTTTFGLLPPNKAKTIGQVLSRNLALRNDRPSSVDEQYIANSAKVIDAAKAVLARDKSTFGGPLRKADLKPPSLNDRVEMMIMKHMNRRKAVQRTIHHPSLKLGLGLKAGGWGITANPAFNG